MINPFTKIFARGFKPVAKPASQGLPSYSGNASLTAQLKTYVPGGGFRNMPESGAIKNLPPSHSGV
jgi:hypothetical protein